MKRGIERFAYFFGNLDVAGKKSRAGVGTNSPCAGFESLYYPFLGEGSGRVVDAKTREPIKNALVTVRRLTAGGKSLPCPKIYE